ncbi:protein FAM151B isoform X2 [Hemicordylus capensis]|uniref:protein FAM151B isoform X2 n=1 Tax=Hemicordylus capensis TaxID=884348 RepID=UPI002304051D|nr:protein FAM151B isoform X2 [Hemicordylus capensis]
MRLPESCGASTSRSRGLEYLEAFCAAGRAGMELREHGPWSENILDYFLNAKQIKTRDGAEIIWYHRANNKMQMTEAIQSAAHMIEADILLCEGEGSSEPIMAHPPETNSDNTLKEWLNEIKNTNKGIKLDFKSLAAVNPSMKILRDINLRQPVWINADILPGPNGSNCIVDGKSFLDTVTSFFPDVTLSLGWTTGWINLKCNKGYSSAMVQEMAAICGDLTQPVTFPVRAALVRQSISELLWLLQQSNRYTLTIWTGKLDEYSVEDLLFIRDTFDKSKVFYDILEPQNSEFRKAIGMEVST